MNKGEKIMLNKETKTRAEKMAQNFAPLFKEAAKLADKWGKAYKESKQAHQVAAFWQYVGTASEGHYCETVSEAEKEEARTTKARDRKEWSDKLFKKYIEESEKENSERAANANYMNYLYYMCEIMGEALRPIACDIYKQRGDTFQQFADIINTAQTLTEYTARKVKYYIYIDCVFSDEICLKICANGGGACGAYSHIYRYYKTENPSDPESVEKPHTMTGNQWAQRLAALKQYEEKARNLQREQWKKARAWGMLDACELLDSPRTTKAR